MASLFVVSNTPPAATDPVQEPKIDLSGFSIQAGIHFRF